MVKSQYLYKKCMWFHYVTRMLNAPLSETLCIRCWESFQTMKNFWDFKITLSMKHSLSGIHQFANRELVNLFRQSPTHMGQMKACITPLPAHSGHLSASFKKDNDHAGRQAIFIKHPHVCAVLTTPVWGSLLLLHPLRWFILAYRVVFNY